MARMYLISAFHFSAQDVFVDIRLLHDARIIRFLFLTLRLIHASCAYRLNPELQSNNRS